MLRSAQTKYNLSMKIISIIYECTFSEVLFTVWLIVLGFNETSTLVGHFVSSPREIEEIVEEMKERDGEKEENEWKWRNRRNKNIPPVPLSASRIAGLAQL